MTTAASAARRLSPAQMFALAIGVFYLATGIVGFALLGTGSGELFILSVNPLHLIIHIVVFGVVWIYAAKSHDLAKTMNLVLGILLIVIGVLGLPGWLGWLNIGGGVADEHFWLTLATGLLGIAFGTVAAGRATRATA